MAPLLGLYRHASPEVFAGQAYEAFDFRADLCSFGLLT